MLKRLLVGLVLGAIIGGVVAAILVQGLGITVFTNPFFAYLAAAATGVVTGLVAGKPIWSGEGRIEAGLKAFFGLLLSLGAMFALRTWVHASVDLAALKAGVGEVGMLPAASLPAIAALLSAFFELDNTPGSKDEKEAKTASKSDDKKVRVAKEEEQEEEEDEEPAQGKKKR